MNDSIVIIARSSPFFAPPTLRDSDLEIQAPDAATRPPDDEGRAVVTVTQAARKHLARELRPGAPPGASEGCACFRLAAESNRKLSTTVTRPAPGDVLVRHEERVVLAIAPELADKLERNTIDIEEVDDGRKALIIL